jgi:hypothetical protein
MTPFSLVKSAVALCPDRSASFVAPSSDHTPERLAARAEELSTVGFGLCEKTSAVKMQL